MPTRSRSLRGRRKQAPVLSTGLHWGGREGARLALLLAGLAAAAFLAWPRVSIERSGEWRTVLAGFQLQKETGQFIGATTALVHLHGLDGRPARVRFTLAYRVRGETVKVYLIGPGGVRPLALQSGPVEVEVPLDGSRDAEIRLESIASPNPRPLVVSNLRMERDLTAGQLGVSLLPLLTGALAFMVLGRRGPWRDATLIALFAVVASTVLLIAALDPVRFRSFDPNLTEALPVWLALGFAAVGLSRTSSRSTAMALFGVTLSLHLHTAHSGFVYDDRLWSRPWTLAEVASTFVGSEDPKGISGQQYRPIPSITHALDHFVYGSNAAAFHVTNMGFHAASAWFLFLLLGRLAVPRMASFLGALAYAVHPMSASSIGWISQRTDSLVDIFMLATGLVFLGPLGTKPLRVLGVALLAMWSKETAVMLPALLALLAWAGLERPEQRARFPVWRALAGFAVLYVAVWVSLFPEKTIDRMDRTAEMSWRSFFGSLFGQMFHPSGFEAWFNTRERTPDLSWALVAGLLCALCLAGSRMDRTRARFWRVACMGPLLSAVLVLPFRGHDAVVDFYRLGHTPSLGFGLLVGGIAAVLVSESRARALVAGALVLLTLGPIARETSAAWGYPGFQFRMALRFNLDNPFFLGGLTPEMRQDLEREGRFEAHRDEPLKVPFE